MIPCIVNDLFDKTRHTFLSESGRYIYHIAIIDYLQDYNLEKKLENRLKVFINKEGAEISAIQPKEYATRYLRFMRDKVIIDQNSEAKVGQDQDILRKFTTRKF